MRMTFWAALFVLVLPAMVIGQEADRSNAQPVAGASRGARPKMCKPGGRCSISGNSCAFDRHCFTGQKCQYEGATRFVDNNDGTITDLMTCLMWEKKTGTRVTFMPDGEIFKQRVFKYETIAERLRELAFLNSSVTLKIVDLRNKSEAADVFRFKGGLVEFVQYIDATRPSIMRKPFYARGGGKDDSGRMVDVEAAFQYNDQYSENIFTYVNNINTHEGGTHLVGFRTALTRSLNTHAYKNGLLKEGGLSLSGEDFREGFTGIVSVKVPDPQFEGQTKTKLGNSEVKSIVEGVIGEALSAWLDENPGDARRIIDKSLRAAEAREAARKARDLTRRKNALTSG
jgi:DNA gyrase subunit B